MKLKIEEMSEELAFTKNSMKVLLLDQYWQPVAVITWQKAMSLILTTHKQKAQVVQEYPDKVIHSVNKSFNVPSIVRVFGVGKKRSSIPCTSDNVFYRDQYLCAYCGVKQAKRNLTIDHIFPVVQGGQRSWKNLISACRACNEKKGGRTPKQANMPLLFRPKEPEWSLPFYFKLTKNDPISHWSEYIYGLDQSILINEADAELQLIEND